MSKLSVTSAYLPMVIKKITRYLDLVVVRVIGKSNLMRGTSPCFDIPVLALLRTWSCASHCFMITSTTLLPRNQLNYHQQHNHGGRNSYKAGIGLSKAIRQTERSSDL